ncbi:response regulator transcription factor [bacterium]|nr:response regulator transcription factor [bacterium]
MIRVALLIQNEITREGLRHILKSYKAFSVLDDFQQITAKADADVVITDVVPHKNPKQKSNKTRFILWQDSKEYQSGSALRDGIKAILDGGCGRDEVILAVSRVAEGKIFVSSALAEKLTLSAVGRDTGYQKLSPRELEVLKKISDGNKLTFIAEEMNLSVNTVSTYQSRILKKLNLKTAADLIRHTVKEKLNP